MGLREFLIPQDEVFFTLFDQLSSVVLKGSAELVTLLDNFPEIAGRTRVIKNLEHEGDRLTHEIYDKLNTTFITPLEPPGDLPFASVQDDVSTISTYPRARWDTTGSPSPMPTCELARIIQLSVLELQAATHQLRKIKDPQIIEQRCIEVNRLENLADEVLSRAIQDVFHTNDPIRVLKYKDIYDFLELATDKCEDVANILSDIAIRHA